ncbi:hypothetical protein Goklo_024527 [Gossypium klotzschianum]|uniref:Uncharacterized protein n=1 Tax=Gossypium klotzschianum TaxID=34286 RepID=A0A7J8W5W0_9ROSI|nr:hypothetical protein [Gossypium klotzschianum]
MGWENIGLYSMGLVMVSSTYAINNIHDQTTAEAYACLQ